MVWAYDEQRSAFASWLGKTSQRIGHLKPKESVGAG